MGNSKEIITVEIIVSCMAEYHGMKEEDLIGKRRHKRLVIPRHACFWIARENTNLSLPEIGDYFLRDHTTVMSGLKNYEEKRRALRWVLEDEDQVMIMIKDAMANLPVATIENRLATAVAEATEAINHFSVVIKEAHDMMQKIHDLES